MDIIITLAIVITILFLVRKKLCSILKTDNHIPRTEEIDYPGIVYRNDLINVGGQLWAFPFDQPNRETLQKSMEVGDEVVVTMLVYNSEILYPIHVSLKKTN